jgi:hypothetical protein
MAITEALGGFWQLGEVATSRLKDGLSMRYEHSNKYTRRRPLCPSCAQVMRLAQIASRFGELPDLCTFECRACGVSYVEAA